MGILSNMRSYQQNWVEVSRESLSADDKEVIVEMSVVPSKYGKSVQINFIDGTMKFVPLSRECEDTPCGTIVNADTCQLVTLKRGEEFTVKMLVK